MALYSGPLDAALAGAGFVQFNAVEILLPSINLLLSPQAFDNSGAWVRQGLSGVTADTTTAPDGTTTADKLVENSVNTQHDIHQSVTTANGALAWSVFVKSAGRTAARVQLSDGVTAITVDVDLSTGATSNLVTAGSWTNVSASADPPVSGWVRVNMLATKGAGSAVTAYVITMSGGAISYLGDSASGVYVWGGLLARSSVTPLYDATGYNPIRLLDGSAAPVTISSKQFFGVDATYGTLDGIETLADGEGDEAPVLRLTLKVPSAAAASLLCQATAQGLAVTHWWGLIDPATGQPIGTPDQMFVGEIDVPTLIAAQGGRVVEIECTGIFDRFFDIDEGVNLSNSTHKAVWPGETGFEFVTSVSQPIPWGQDAPRPILVKDGQPGVSNEPGLGSRFGGVGGKPLPVFN